MYMLMLIHFLIQSYSHVHSHTHILIHLFLYSLIHSLTDVLTPSLTPSFTHSLLAHLPTNSFILLFTHLFPCVLIHHSRSKHCKRLEGSSLRHNSLAENELAQ